MKIAVLQENLAKGIGIVSRMVATKAQLPVLSNILMVAEKGKLKLSATNLETGINLWLGGKVEKEGKITVPAKVLADLVNSLPQETVEMEVLEEKLTVRAGRFRAVMNGIGAEEFPEVPSVKGKEKEKGIKIKAKELRESLFRVVVAAGTDEARPVFTGVKLELSRAKMRMAATDGYRLSVKEIKGIKGGEEKKEMVVPAKALAELGKVLTAEEEEVSLVAVEEEKQLLMVYKDMEIVSRLIEGVFPDFDKIIPSTSTTKIELDKEELERAARAAAVFARDSANIVRFKIQGEKLVISANAPQVGENEISLSGEKTGEDAEMAFNSRYLLEMLSVVEGEKLKLETSGALSPGVFRVVGEEGFLHIIMPVRVQG